MEKQTKYRTILISMTIIFGILVLLNSVFALDIYSGQDYSFESEQFEYFEVIGNTSSIEGMNIEWLNGNTTISFDKGFVSDSFTLILFNTEKEIITEHHYESGGSSGGGTTTKYVDRDIIKTEVITLPGEKEVVTETIPGETIIENKIPVWCWLLILFCFVVLVIVIFVKFNTGVGEKI